MYVDHPERRAETPGYMWMSGTSFAAPIVSGTAAWILAAHPTWTPDEVKGALMVSAQPAAGQTTWAMGVGELKAGKAANVTEPPDPNAGLRAFVVPDPDGGTAPVFDPQAWAAGNGNVTIHQTQRLPHHTPAQWTLRSVEFNEHRPSLKGV